MIFYRSTVTPCFVPVGRLESMEGLAFITRVEVVEQVACLTDSGIELHRFLNRHGLIVAELLPHVQLSCVVLHLENKRSNRNILSIEGVDLDYVSVQSTFNCFLPVIEVRIGLVLTYEARRANHCLSHLRALFDVLEVLIVDG